ncbi:hypothetical protein BJX68DRAFT_190218 [Aspergillus pseudodeflectus]|uniref:BTB domain-containing protein n=1 Tax=Aspergillus pseudodeflectus TaxID=176178 RepID=A0ABR4JIX5_9EURO
MADQHLHRYNRATFPHGTSGRPAAYVAPPPRGPDVWEPARHRGEIDVHAWQEAMVYYCRRMGFRRKQLVASLGRFMLNHEFHDMTIVCGNRNVEFPCHKAIVYAQSKKIRSMCREADVGEQNPVVRIICHPLPFRLTMEYLYTCDYHFFYKWDFPSHFQAQGQTIPVDYVDRLDCCELSLHLQIHLLAIRLRIPGLKYLSANNMIQTLGRSAFPTVFPRFVREVYAIIKKQNALIKRLLVKYTVGVVGGRNPRNHYEGRFPGYIFREIPEFARDFWYGRIGYPGSNALDIETGMHIAETQWEC